MKKTLWSHDFIIITLGTLISAIGSTAMSFALSLVVFDHTFINPYDRNFHCDIPDADGSDSHSGSTAGRWLLQKALDCYAG